MSTKKALRQLTDLEDAFIEALFGEAKGDPRAAVKIAGYPTGTKWQTVVSNLNDHILNRTEEFLAAIAPRAALGLAEALNDPTTPGIKNAIASAMQVLDRIGISRKDRLEITSGDGSAVFILPAKDVE